MGRTSALLLAQAHDALEHKLHAGALVGAQPARQHGVDLDGRPRAALGRRPQHQRLAGRGPTILRAAGNQGLVLQYRGLYTRLEKATSTSFV